MTSFKKIIDSYKSRKFNETVIDGKSFIKREKINNSQLIEIYNIIGSSYVNLKDYNLAIKEFRKALNLKPNKKLESIIISNIAKLNMITKDYIEAIKYYNKLLINDSNNLDYLILLSECYGHTMRYEDSIEILKKALKLDSSNYKVLDKIGQNYVKIKFFKEALICFNDGLKISQNNFSLLHNKAITLNYLNRHNESIRILEKLIKENQDQYFLFNSLGIVYKEIGDIEKAEKNFLKAISINPKHEMSNYNLANILINSGRSKESIPYMKNSGYLGKASTLEIFYELNLIEEYEELIDEFILLDPFNRRIASIASFVSEQKNIVNNYPFCKNPMDYLIHTNIKNQLLEKKFSFSGLKNELKKYKKIWEPESSTTINGTQTKENLFRKKSHYLFILEDQIKEEIKKYRLRFLDSESYFIKKFPDQLNIESWLVTLKKNGFQGSHIHAEGWLSGVFYIDLPPNKKSNEGAIKFCLRGFNYQMKKNATKEKTINPKKYDLVLFPSSLFHETLPFSSNQERLCIAFDLSPREELRTKF